MRESLKKKDVDAIIKLSHTPRVTDGMQQMLEHVGLGSLVPNTVVFGGVHENGVEFGKVIQLAYQMHYNIVIFNDSKTLESANGDIHIWWDHQYPRNGDLMLVLSYMLQKNRAWKKAKIHLQGITASELTKDATLAELHDLTVKRRLPLNLNVYVSPNFGEEFCQLVSNFSKEASIVFISLRPPRETESMEDYANYLNSMFQSADAFPPLPWS